MANTYNTWNRPIEIYKIRVRLGAPRRRGPLAFVQPCPVGVTPLLVLLMFCKDDDWLMYDNCVDVLAAAEASDGRWRGNSCFASEHIHCRRDVWARSTAWHVLLWSCCLQDGIKLAIQQLAPAPCRHCSAHALITRCIDELVCQCMQTVTDFTSLIDFTLTALQICNFNLNLCTRH